MPVQLHVVCPTCGRRAVARIGWSSDNAYEIRCSKCMFRRTGVEYSKLPPLFYRVAARGSELWAWNRDHLLDILKALEAPSAQKNRLPVARIFARREWLRHRTEFAKQIRRELRDAA